MNNKIFMSKSHTMIILYNNSTLINCKNVGGWRVQSISDPNDFGIELDSCLFYTITLKKEA